MFSLYDKNHILPNVTKVDMLSNNEKLPDKTFKTAFM